MGGGTDTRVCFDTVSIHVSKLYIEQKGLNLSYIAIVYVTQLHELKQYLINLDIL